MGSIRSNPGAIDVRQLGTLDYLSAWQLQRDLAGARVAGGPDTLLLLEHPTAAIEDRTMSADLGRILREVSDGHGVGWLALTEDAEFARASGATRLTLSPATGAVAGESVWRRMWQ